MLIGSESPAPSIQVGGETLVYEAVQTVVSQFPGGDACVIVNEGGDPVRADAGSGQPSGMFRGEDQPEFLAEVRVVRAGDGHRTGDRPQDRQRIVVAHIGYAEGRLGRVHGDDRVPGREPEPGTEGLPG